MVKKLGANRKALMYYKMSVMMVAGLVGMASVPAAWAESVERSDVTRINTPKPRGLSKLLGNEPTGFNEIPAQQTPSTVGGRTINITQPTVPDTVQPAQPVQQQVRQPPAPRQLQQFEPAPKKAVARKRRKKRRSGIKEARWWETEGNPKVFAFSQCISGYARSQAQSTPKLNLQSVVAKAIKSDCDSQFSVMSQALSSRFGARKSRKLAKELTGSTFVPAVRKAVLKVRQEQRIAAANSAPQPTAAPATQPAIAAAATAPQAPLPVSGEVELELAKEEMFSCYRDTADRVGPQPNLQIDAVVDQVLLDCSDNTRAFFTRLFEIYPHAPGAQAERMRKAIATNYRPAIAKRITALRAAGVTVSKQKITSTAQ
jgi:hypothetical protein